MDNLFQKNLEDYQDHPDPAVWNRIRNSLDDRKKSRTVPAWWRWGAAAAVLLGILILTTPREGEEPDLPALTNETPGQEAEQQERTGLPEVESDSRKPLTGNSPSAGDDTGTTPQVTEVNNASASPLRGNAVGEGQAVSGSSGESVASAALPSGRNSTGLVSANVESPSEKASFQGVVEPSPAVSAPSTGQPAIETVAVDAEKDMEGPEKQSIFDAIAESEAAGLAAEEGEADKWSLGPSVAPVYFNSFGSGSPIASNFVDNSKTGSFNMSYGLQVSYRLSGKLRLRSGVHRVDYGYNTEDVGFTSNPSARPSSLIRTISYSEESKNLVVQSMAGGQEGMEQNAVDVLAPSPAREGQMVQEFGYLEIPLEMQYSLIDKKWGVDLIGGMSSLFLVNNAVSLESSGTVTEMGEATNINSLNFSTNFGLGFFYRFNPSFELNLQPMFKYQLNTFSETSGAFRPYSVGIYSGLSFRF